MEALNILGVWYEVPVVIVLVQEVGVNELPRHHRGAGMNKTSKNISPSFQGPQTSDRVQTYNIIMKQVCPGIDNIFMPMPWGSKSYHFGYPT